MLSFVQIHRQEVGDNSQRQALEGANSFVLVVSKNLLQMSFPYSGDGGYYSHVLLLVRVFKKTTNIFSLFNYHIDFMNQNLNI
ncbi:hypothetical protein MANES_02G152250v8 [Manihot esculenta]|uniref:Uncharacterized protein n=1 Tax=Manihot esculenta TaxID=3983 RepID=A0ACB7I7I9_MANES|nr:hypothetical protein MANES_02G152250v8 [Manihot esculenta]